MCLTETLVISCTISRILSQIDHQGPNWTLLTLNQTVFFRKWPKSRKMPKLGSLSATFLGKFMPNREKVIQQFLRKLPQNKQKITKFDLSDLYK